jgi:hypothetical protein
MHNRLADYDRWRVANEGIEFSLFDYAYGCLRTSGAEADLIVAIASLVWPRFLEVGGLVFLAEQYTVEKVQALSDQGIAGVELEYWINLFSIDGFFHGLPGVSAEHAEFLAQVLAKAWRAKLTTEFPLREFVVEPVRAGSVRFPV